jgi:hypothetical protein
MTRIWGENSKSPMEPSQGDERRKEERKRVGRKRKGGAAIFCSGVALGWLARLDQRGTVLASVARRVCTALMSRASAHSATPS